MKWLLLSPPFTRGYQECHSHRAGSQQGRIWTQAVQLLRRSSLRYALKVVSRQSEGKGDPKDKFGDLDHKLQTGRRGGVPWRGHKGPPTSKNAQSSPDASPTLPKSAWPLGRPLSSRFTPLSLTVHEMHSCPFPPQCNLSLSHLAF